MHLYEATINLNSKNLNQVIKTDLTAAEMLLLKHIHCGKESGGFETIVNVKFLRDKPRSDAEERQRLVGEEGDAEKMLLPLYQMKQFREVFPTDYQPLPQVLPSSFKVSGIGSAPVPTEPVVIQEDNFTE